MDGGLPKGARAAARWSLVRHRDGATGHPGQHPRELCPSDWLVGEGRLQRDRPCHPLPGRGPAARAGICRRPCPTPSSYYPWRIEIVRGTEGVVTARVETPCRQTDGMTRTGTEMRASDFRDIQLLAAAPSPRSCSTIRTITWSVRAFKLQASTKHEAARQ
jgi:hypothetical protein